MHQVDETGHMKVCIGGDIVRRRAVIEAFWPGLGCNVVQYARPELRPGETLCERIGMIPAIIRGPA